jgi:hypothetical protein
MTEHSGLEFGSLKVAAVLEILAAPGGICVVLQSCDPVMEACDQSVRGSLLADWAGDSVRIYSQVG